ncbi:g2420 [Coccomyxa viridis]|uniref:G2420 protein n=1 Tax=Coccomyxa viridis TaxID=1274662 RepID=A0ABP1FMM2_9CHLO
MVSEACQQYMQHVDAAAAHSGPAQDVLSILEAAQQAAEAQKESKGGPLEDLLMDAALRLHAALTDLAHSLMAEPHSSMATAIAGVTPRALTEDAASQQLLAQEQALDMLCCAVDKAREGKHQYLSGTLHNVAKALAHAQPQPDMHSALLAAGYGTRLRLEGPLQPDTAPGGDEAEEQPQSPLQRPPNYLSAMLTYMAQVGDAVAEADPAPSEAQNYFAMLQETPSTLLPRLVAQWGCSDSTAERVASLLGSDLVHEVLKAVIGPVRLQQDASQQDGQPPADASQTTGCVCPTCTTTAATSEALSGVRCRVPLLEQASKPDEGREDLSLPEGLQQQGNEQENAEDMDAAAESSILPILGSVGSMGKKATIKSLRSPILKELHGIAPLRASLGAALALLQDCDAQSDGSVPLAPAPSAPTASAGMTAPGRLHSSYDSSDSDLAEAGREGGGAASGLASTCVLGADAEELLILALRGSDAQEPLRQWLKLLLQSSPKLASLQALAADHGELPAVLATDHRRTAKKLAEAGRWVEAVHEAQEAHTLDDALLLRAITGLAEQVQRGDMHEDAQDKLWECCRCLSHTEAAAGAVLQHLGVWDLHKAHDLLNWAQQHIPENNAIHERLEETLKDLSFCKDVLSHPEAFSEFKSWQSVKRALDEDPVLLGRRLITCGASAAARELCSVRQSPASYCIEAHVAYLSGLLSSSEAENKLLDTMRCLRALPEAQAIEVALQLAGSPQLASGSSQALLLSFLRERQTRLSAGQRSSFGAITLSLHVPQPWRERLSHLLGRPDLLLESLIMAQQFDAAREILQQAPHLQSDNLLRQYARKAVNCQSENLLERASSMALTDKDVAPSILTGDAKQNAIIRQHFRYLIAPSAALVACILSLSSSEVAAAESALRVASDLVKQQLSLDTNALAGDETRMEPALEAASAAVALLGYAGEQLDKLASAGHKSVKTTAAATSIRAEVAELARRADLIQVLLSNAVPVSMQSLETTAQVEQLMGQLLQQEHYGLAAYVGKRWNLPVQHAWEQWALSLVLLGRYEDAETRLKQAMKYADDSQSNRTPEEITLSSVKALEETAPLNLDGLQSLCSALTTAAMQENEGPLSVSDYLKVLRGPQKLPTPQAAAYKSMPEAQMVGRRIALAERLLHDHAPGSLLPFMFRHGRAAAACELAFPPASGAVGDSSNHHADARYSAESLLELACGHGELRTLQRTLAAGGHRGRKALMGICEKLSQAPDHPDHDGPARAADRLPVEDRLQFVHRCHLAMHRPDLAGQACVQLSCLAPDFTTAIRQLANAVLHFESASAQGCKALSKAEATERILLAHMQSQVYEDAAASAAAEARPLFGVRIPGLGLPANSELRPGDFCLYEDVPGTGLPSAQERRLAVAMRLLPRRFDLGFRALHAFCPAQTARIFAAVAAALAAQGRTAELRGLLQNIQGLVTSDEWDQVLTAAVDTLASAPDGTGRWSAAWSGSEALSSPAEELILSMHSPHAQVEAFLRLSCCEQAFRTASNAGNTAAVRRVLAEARRRSDVDVVALCDEYLRLNRWAPS